MLVEDYAVAPNVGWKIRERIGTVRPEFVLCDLGWNLSNNPLVSLTHETKLKPQKLHGTHCESKHLSIVPPHPRFV